MSEPVQKIQESDPKLTLLPTVVEDIDSSSTTSNSDTETIVVEEEEPFIQENENENDEFNEWILRGINVRILRRPNSEDEAATFESMILSELRLPGDPSLDDMRVALSTSELGDPMRDIFFPKWNKSLYVTIDGVEQTVENDEQLQSMLHKEMEKQGSIVLNMQECRDARYSRRKQVVMPQMFYPYMFYQTTSANSPVYFDGAPNSYYHPYACQFLPPFAVPFMYVPMHGNQ